MTLDRAHITFAWYAGKRTEEIDTTVLTYQESEHQISLQNHQQNQQQSVQSGPEMWTETEATSKGHAQEQMMQTRLP